MMMGRLGLKSVWYFSKALKAFSSKTPTRREARFLVSETEHTIVYACKQGGDFAFVVGH
jgi:hypothetical protein